MPKKKPELQRDSSKSDPGKSSATKAPGRPDGGEFKAGYKQALEELIDASLKSKLGRGGRRGEDTGKRPLKDR